MSPRSHPFPRLTAWLVLSIAALTLVVAAGTPTARADEPDPCPSRDCSDPTTSTSEPRTTTTEQPPPPPPPPTTTTTTEAPPPPPPPPTTTTTERPPVFFGAATKDAPSRRTTTTTTARRARVARQEPAPPAAIDPVPAPTTSTTPVDGPRGSATELALTDVAPAGAASGGRTALWVVAVVLGIGIAVGLIGLDRRMSGRRRP